MEKVENIIFDLGGVILDIDYNLTREAFEKLGVVHFDEMYSQSTANQLFRKLETGKIQEEDFYKEFNYCTGLHLSPAEIRKAWDAMLLSFREDSLQFLDELRHKYPIFLLSNTNYIHIDSFKKIFHQKKRDKTFEEYFTRAFYSCEIGFRKPDAECYEWVLNELSIEAGKALLIDDSLVNIEGAEKAGMQTIYLTPGKQIQDLEFIKIPRP
jgi:putative hydrolase of the HAD superfamily